MSYLTTVAILLCATGTNSDCKSSENSRILVERLRELGKSFEFAKIHCTRGETFPVPSTFFNGYEYQVAKRYAIKFKALEPDYNCPTPEDVYRAVNRVLSGLGEVRLMFEDRFRWVKRRAYIGLASIMREREIAHAVCCELALRVNLLRDICAVMIKIAGVDCRACATWSTMAYICDREKLDILRVILKYTDSWRIR